MSNEVLDYVELNTAKAFPRKLYSKNVEYQVAKSFDNSKIYKIYKKIDPSKVEILISNTDRTSDIKTRYNLSVPIQEYYKENKDEFIALAEKTSKSKIEELENEQKEFEKHIPYFIRYENNYIWQIYYSDIEDKYFMLFPANEGETESLFFMIKQKLTGEFKNIYVPICQVEYNPLVFKDKKKISDIENYMWIYTKSWPTTYEYTDEKGNVKLYIIGETILQENFKSKYRVEINDEKELNRYYTLLKALFIITTETKYTYRFDVQIALDGSVSFLYNKKEVNIDNLQQFVTKETAKQQNLKYEIKKQIEQDEKVLCKLKDIIARQTLMYSKQEKQIVMFMDCKKSFFKKVKFFFKGGKKFTKDDKEMLTEIKEAAENTKNEESKSNELNIDDTILESSTAFTIADFVSTTLETRKILNKQKDLKQDIKALRLKQTNMTRKIENAEKYIEEIEEHKKNIFEFWKFTNKDNLQSLDEGKGEEEKKEKKQKVFKFDDDLEDFCTNMDSIERKKLSIAECASVYAAKYVLPAINSTVTKSDTYTIQEVYEKIKEEYAPDKNLANIFGGITDDYTKVKMLNGKKHRESHRDLYQVLRFNETTSLEDFKERMREVSRYINEAYQKITVPYDMPLYYEKRNKGYVIGNIDPYEILKDDNVDKIYKVYANEDTHAVFFTNIICYDNMNQTLPLGMDETKALIMKVGENKKIGECMVNILVEQDKFNIKVKKVRVIEEEKRKIAM